jgi:hypothetical protein
LFEDGQWVVMRRPLGSSMMNVRYGTVVDTPDGPVVKAD